MASRTHDISSANQGSIEAVASNSIARCRTVLAAAVLAAALFREPISRIIRPNRETKKIGVLVGVPNLRHHQQFKMLRRRFLPRLWNPKERLRPCRLRAKRR